MSIEPSGRPPIEVAVASHGSLLRDALRSALDATPGTVVTGTAESGPVLTSLVSRTTPDVVVLDATMPPEGGVRCIESIRLQAPSTKVLLLAEDDLSVLLIDAFRSGASGLLPKTVSLRELVDAIGTVHRGEMVVPSALLADLIRGLVSRRDVDNASMRLGRLTDREREVLELLGDGADNRAIADRLVISPLTARTHVNNVMRKLKVHSRLEAAMFMARHGLGVDPSFRGTSIRQVQ